MKKPSRNGRRYRGRKQTGRMVWTGMAVAAAVLGVGLLVTPVRFLGVLLLLLTVCCGIGTVLGRWAEISRRGRLWKRFFCFCAAAAAAVFCVTEVCIVRAGQQTEEECPAAAVIVLGAGVQGKTPSMALQSRINRAAEYLSAHPELPAVLSGGQGADEEISEAQAIYQGLTEKGIAPERLYLEDQSRSTAENFRYAAEELRRLGIDPSITEIAVVTNDFHMFRSRFLAEAAGVRMVSVPAKLPLRWLSANCAVREFFALGKMLLYRVMG